MINHPWFTLCYKLPLHHWLTKMTSITINVMISYLSHIFDRTKNLRWLFDVFIWNISIENNVEGFAEITNNVIKYSFYRYTSIKARKDILECKARLFYFQIYSRLDELKSPRKRVCAQTYYIFKVGESSRLFFFTSYWDIWNGLYFYWV